MPQPASRSKRAAQTNAPAERPHKGLTKTQEELAELAADMLINGGGTPEVTLLLKALDQHEYRRFLANLYKGSKTPAELQALLDERNAKYGPTIERWLRHLLAEWPAPRVEKGKDSGSETKALQAVKDVACAGIKGQLQYAFDNFLFQEEGVEAHWVLNEILEYVTSGSYDLAESFSVVFEKDETYIRVPWNFRTKVRDFVALLDKKAA